MDVDKATDATSGKKHSLGTKSVENLDGPQPMMTPVKEKPTEEKDVSMYMDGNSSGVEGKAEADAASKTMAERVADTKKQKGARASTEAAPREGMDIAKSNKEDCLENSSFAKRLAQAPTGQRQKK